jgi:nucleotide-binding universal stress UspA family protein
MKILIGVDDSPHSNAALEFVRKVPWPAGSRAIVASAVSLRVPAFSEVYVPTTPTDDLYKEDVRLHEEMVSRAEQKLRDSGLKTEARVLHGDPRVAMIEAATAEGADLMVVGSHGRTGLAKLVMGSVASYLVTHAPCSVMVVKTPKR